MGVDLWLTLAIMVGAIVLFATERLPVDVVALLVLTSLLGFGILTPTQALSGFSSPATITVAAMFVLSAGMLRSGALSALGSALARIRRGWLFSLVMMTLVGALSGVINNTAAVAVFLPIVVTAAIANGRPPSKFLIPLSFAAQFGGVCTLVGTSTNLLVDSLARQAGLAGFGLFEFTRLGLVFVAVGVTYLLLAGRWLLPDLGTPRSDVEDRAGRYVVELLVPAGSPALGRRGSEVLATDAGDITVLEILRDGTMVRSPRNEPVQVGDRLLVRGAWSDIELARRKLRLAFDSIAPDLEGDPAAARVHVEVMVAPGSHLIDKTLAGMRFGHTYRCRVHGLRRQHLTVRQPLDRVALAVGDELLLDAPLASVDALRSDPGLVVMGQREQQRIDVGRAWLSALIVVAVVTVAGLGWLPIVASALLGCLALVVTRCLTPSQAYAAVDWRVVMLLAGVLPLGLALESSGGARWLAAHAIDSIGSYGPTFTLAMVYLLTALLTEAMSNNAAAVVMVPIALSAANALGIDPKPLLVAVAFAASTSFSTPMGYQTNAMVYTAGGYRFLDFTRVGVPLNLIFWVLAVILIPRYFPF